MAAKLTADERRYAILESVVPLFAAQGFAGVTTRMIADRAGVSEALLYRHFPSKEALYAEVQDFLCRRVVALDTWLDGLKPSTATLVEVVHMLARFVIDPPPQLPMPGVFPRLMVQSMLEDGVFAKLQWERNTHRLVTLMRASIAAARRRGDLKDDDGAPVEARAAIAQTTILGAYLMTQPGYPDGGSVGERPRLVVDVVRAVLRGIGLGPAEISGLYRPAAMDAALAGRIAGQAATEPAEESR